MADFVWGDNGAQLTPEQVAARRKVAESMMQEAGDYSPVKSVWQGVARAAKGIIGGMQARDANEADKVNAEANKQMIAALLSGGVSSPDAPTAAGSAVVPMGSGGPLSAGPPAPDASGKIYSNDEPSPMDPPSGADRQRMIATILGEAGNEPQLGKDAVASVIRTRAVDGSYGGNTPSAVVTAPNQFEPWNTAEGRQRMALAAADPRQAAAADAAIASAYGEGGKAPEDPTEGMTHFYSPGGQAALGRKAPAWAGGESVTIGGHVFNSPDDAAAGAKPVQVASADPAALPVNATEAQGFVVPGQPVTAAAPTPAVAKVSGALGGVNPALLQAYTSPYASESTKKIAGLLLQAQMGKEKKDTFSQQTDADGNIWSVNNATGQRTVALKRDQTYTAPFKDDQGNLVQKDASGKVSVLSAAEKSPTSVAEYKFYKDNFKPSGDRQSPMEYDTWATAKARAGAMNVGNVTMNAGGGSDKQIFDTFDERAKEARAVATGLVGLRNAREALQGAGGVITGAGADARLSLQKVGSLLGVSDPTAIQNTETFRAAIAPQIASVLKSTVGTANISNSDRTFAEKAAGGSIELDQGSINRLLNIMEKASIARLQDHQEQLDVVYPDPTANKRERALFGVKVPTSAAPPAGATKSGVKWSVE